VQELRHTKVDAGTARGGLLHPAPQLADGVVGLGDHLILTRQRRTLKSPINPTSPRHEPRQVSLRSRVNSTNKSHRFLLFSASRGIFPVIFRKNRTNNRFLVLLVDAQGGMLLQFLVCARLKPIPRFLPPINLAGGAITKRKEQYQ